MENLEVVFFNGLDLFEKNDGLFVRIVRYGSMRYNIYRALPLFFRIAKMCCEHVHAVDYDHLIIMKCQ